MQFVIHQRQEFIVRTWITSLARSEQSRNLMTVGN